jgi:hypothetical protein
LKNGSTAPSNVTSAVKENATLAAVLKFWRPRMMVAEAESVNVVSRIAVAHHFGCFFRDRV